MSAPRPVPVILVPGWSDRARALRHVRRHLLTAGWPERSIFSIEFRDRYGSNIDHAGEIADAIERVCDMLQVREVDVIAHSMGGLAVRYLLGHSGQAGRIRRVVFLGSPHAGTYVAYLALGKGAGEMRPGSPFLRQLNEQEPARARLFCLRSPVDLRIMPGSSAFLQGAENRTVGGLGHRHLLWSKRVLEAVLQILK